MIKRGVLADPRMAGKYREFLASRGTAPYNPPGLDYNRGQQTRNAMQGRDTYRTTQRPRFGGGDRLQQFLRNTSNEQAGLPRPAQPAPVQFGTARRTY